MRRGAADAHDDALQLLGLDQQDVRQRQLRRHQHDGAGERAVALGDAEQVAQRALADVLDVEGALLQVRVVEARELLAPSR